MSDQTTAAAPAYEGVIYETDGAVAKITLNRPDSLNGWTRDFGYELLDALRRASADAAVRAVILTGAGRAFSSGADLKAGGTVGENGKPDVLSAIRDPFHPIMVQVRTMPEPVVAAVNGPAVGIGCGLALACDLIVAGESAYFLLAFVNIGLTLDGGNSLFLPSRVGIARASELALLGERLPATKALEWGLVNYVVPDAELTRTAGELAARLAAGPPGSYAATKELLNRQVYPDLEANLDHEGVLQQQRAESADFAEGVMAFLMKRKPNFTGS